MIPILVVVLIVLFAVAGSYLAFMRGIKSADDEIYSIPSAQRPWAESFSPARPSYATRPDPGVSAGLGIATTVIRTIGAIV